MSIERTCHDCMYCIVQLEGWSDWTVDGSEATCHIRQNPHMPVNDYASEEKQEQAFAFGDACPNFREGGKLTIGVEDDANEELVRHFGGSA